MTADNRLREFGFKFLHLILVTNKELKRFKIRNDDICAQCKNSDSLECTFLECPINVLKFYYGKPIVAKFKNDFLTIQSLF